MVDVAVGVEVLVSVRIVVDVADGVADGCVALGKGAWVVVCVGCCVGVKEGANVGNRVAVGKNVLVGKAVGTDGMLSEADVAVGVGDITAGNVGGATASPSRGAVDSRNIPPQ